MKKLISLLLSIVMVVSFAPAAFASDQTTVDDGELVDQNVEQSLEEIETDEAVGGENDVLYDESATEVTEEEQNSEEELLSQGESNLKVFTIGSGKYRTSFSQEKIDYRKVGVEIPDRKALVSAGFTKEKIEVYYKYDGNVTQKATKTVDLKKSTSSSFSMTFPNYGKFTVKLSFYKGSKVSKTVTGSANCIAKEYNIAPIVATFPVTMFSLNLWNISKSEDGSPIPTFVSLQRPKAFNWSNLPSNVYWQPNLTKKQVETKTNFDTKTEKFADYVKVLYTTNKSAHFNLYINDAYSKYILRLMCANGIPEENYDVIYLSDGSGTYAKFQEAFAGDNPEAKYQTMAEDWAAAKTYAYENHAVKLPAHYYSSSRYATVVANEDDNATLWVARKNKDTYNSNNSVDEAFVTKYVLGCDSILQKSINTFLQALGTKEQVEFKKLYNFGGQMFEKAETENKQIMMILGSRVTGEPGFEANAKFLQLQYGHDNYVYYYKGHPATPTEMYPAKQEQLDRLGIIDVNSSIAAELILFFYPELHMAGYSSSTFNSVSNPDMASGIFNKSKEQALADSSLKTLVEQDAFQFYIYKGDVSSFAGIDESHDNYIVDFQKKYCSSQGGLYDCAVYDFTSDVIYYYRTEENAKVLTKIAFGTISANTPVINVAKHTATLQWTKIANADKYQIKYKLSGVSDWRTTDWIENNQYVLTNLKDGQTVAYKVKAKKEINGQDFTSDWSKTRYALVRTAKTRISVKNKTITATCNKVKGANEYRVAYRLSTSSTYKHKNSKNPKFVIKNLKKGTYYVKIRPVKVVKTTKVSKYYGQYSTARKCVVK